MAILKAAASFFVGNSTPATLIMGFIDTMRAEGHMVESICRVLRQRPAEPSCSINLEEPAWLAGFYTAGIRPRKMTFGPPFAI